MFDLKNVDVKALRNDLVKNAVIIVVARVIRFYLTETALAGGASNVLSYLSHDDSFTYPLVCTLLGFTFFHVVVSPSLSQMQ